MRTLIITCFVAVSVLVSSCTTTSLSPNNQMITDSTVINTLESKEMILTIVLVRDTDEGQVLFMKDNNGQEYTSITEASREEYLNVEAGDKVSITALEIIKTPRAYMIIPSKIRAIN